MLLSFPRHSIDSIGDCRSVLMQLPTVMHAIANCAGLNSKDVSAWQACPRRANSVAAPSALTRSQLLLALSPAAAIGLAASLSTFAPAIPDHVQPVYVAAI